MRILHLLAPASYGGLETVVAQLARGQHRRGNAVRVALLLSDMHSHPMIDDLGRDGVRVEPLLVPGRGYLKERACVARLIQHEDVQVLHTHGYRPDVVDAGVARRLRRATVTTVHGFTGGSLRNRLYERLQVRAFRQLDAVVSVSRPLAELLALRGVPRDRLHVVPNAYEPPVAPLTREEARRRLGIADGHSVIGWVGRLSREKGADVFVEALGRLTRRDWRAVLIGDGPLRTLLERGAHDDRVRWLGSMQGAGSLFRAFDLFVLSSRTEGTPMALLEAMAAGVPTVVTRVGGVPDVISDGESWLVPSDAPDALATAMDDALARPAEAERRAAAALRRLRSQLAVEPWLTRYDEIYRSIIA